MDSIILAAGRNERLSGLVAPFMKPLILSNGVPLIVSLARRLAAKGTVVIVVAPQNAEAITGIISESNVPGSHNPDSVRYVVQPHPLGPLDALYRALPMVDRSGRVCVACADNVVPDIAIALMEQGALDLHALAVSTVMTESYEEAARFTRIYRSGSHYRFAEGEGTQGAWTRFNGSDGDFLLWVGPFSAYGKDLEQGVDEVRALEPGNMRISPVLEAIVTNGAPLTIVSGGCQDIGIPEALRA